MLKAVQGASDQIRVFLPITKVDEAKRIVYGTLTAEVIDKSGEIFDYESGKVAIQKWSDEQLEASGGKSKGNLREMHSNIAAGKFTDIAFDDDAKKIQGATYVSNDSTWSKVLDGTLTGFSIGGGYEKRWTDPDNSNVKRYTPTISEISLVDNPCVGIATFEVIKADGSHELRKFKHSAEEAQTPMKTTTTEAAAAETPAAIVPAPEQVWKATDGSTHATKKLALAKNAELLTEAASAGVDNALTALSGALETHEAPPAEQVAPAVADPAAEVVADPAAVVAETPAVVAAAEPAVAEKAAANGELKKGLYDIARFANILQDLVWLQQSTVWEAQYEGDESGVPDQIKGAISMLFDALKGMVDEETGEIFPEAEIVEVITKGVSLDGLKKMFTGARLDLLEKVSKEQAAHGSAMAAHHGVMAKCMDGMAKCMKGMGIEMDSDAATMVEDDANDVSVGKMAKAAGMTPDDMLAKAMAHDALAKKFEALAPQLDALTKRLETVERVPVQPKGVVNTALVKRNGNEGSAVSPVDVATQQLNSGVYSPAQANEMMAKAMMSEALSNPVKLN